jgi:hypothetical protein
MMSFVGQNPAGARPVPMMQMMQLGQQQIEMPMMMPYYAPYQQIFWQAGVGQDKLNKSVNATRRPTPTHNYGLAASILLKTILTDAATIKRWAILDSGATSHFLTTDAPVTNILPAAAPLIACQPNGDKVQSTYICTLNLLDLLPAAQAAHIIPSLASHSLLSIVTMCNAGCMVTLTKINCTIVYRGCTIVCGNNRTCAGLWMVPLINIAINQATGPTSTAKPISAFAANVDPHPPPPSMPATFNNVCVPCYQQHSSWHSIAVKSSPPYPVSFHYWSNNTYFACLLLTKVTCTVTDPTLPPRAICKTILSPHVPRLIKLPSQEVCAIQDVLCFAPLADAITGTMYTNIAGAFPVRLFKSMQ